MGVGTALLTALIDKAKEQGVYELLLLNVFSNNERARHLYRRMGFVELNVS